MFAAATSSVSAAGLRERLRSPQRGERIVVPSAGTKNVSLFNASANFRNLSPRIATTTGRGRGKKRFVSTTTTRTRSRTRTTREGGLAAHAARVPPPATTSAAEILSSAFIPLSFRKLEELVVEMMSPAPRQTTLEFVKVVRMLFHLECFGARDRMKHYVYYHASPNDRLGHFDLYHLEVTAVLEDTAALHRAKMEQQLTREEFDSLSADFVADFCALMDDAYFSPLTQKEWDLARAEQFMFTLPCDIKWNNLDYTLMRDFLDKNPNLRRAFPTQFNDSLALFHRGYGVARAKGRFIAEKIDMLVQMCIVEPWLWVLGRPREVFAEQFASWDGAAAGVAARLESQKARVVARLGETMEMTKETIGHTMEWTGLVRNPAGAATNAPAARSYSESFLDSDSFDSESFDTDENADGEIDDDDDDDDEERWEGVDDTTVVERLTLRRLLPTPGAVLSNLFSKMELQEPTFKEVVLLYRMTKPRDGEKAGPTGAGPLIMKSFKDIPMADVDMIFPEVDITVKFKDVLINLVLGLVAIGAFLYTQINGVDLSRKAVGFIGVLGLKVAQSALRLFQAQNRYAGMMAKALQSKSADSQLGMLISLLESMEDQECKEMILCYSVLSSRASPRFKAKEMTVEEIELSCERVLFERFGLRVDFDAEGTVSRLLKEGLVEPRRGGAKYVATPLKKALKKHPILGGLQSLTGGVAVA